AQPILPDTGHDHEAAHLDHVVQLHQVWIIWVLVVDLYDVSLDHHAHSIPDLVLHPRPSSLIWSTAALRIRAAASSSPCALPRWYMCSARSSAEAPCERWAVARSSSSAITSTTRSPRNGSGSRRSEEHTSELQSRFDLVCRLLLENITA